MLQIAGLTLSALLEVNWNITHEAIVKRPPPPIPANYSAWYEYFLARSRGRTNREAISISILFERPLMRTPRHANSKAAWLAPFRPKTLQRRPYKGVNVHAAKRYLEQCLPMRTVYDQCNQTTHDVPSHPAWLNWRNSEDIWGNTTRSFGKWFCENRQQDERTGRNKRFYVERN